MHDAYEHIPGSADAGLILTCEHASNRLPDPWTWPSEDAWIVDTHWAWDPGAAAVVRSMARSRRAEALLARFSRLLVDPNRAEDGLNLFRDTAEGRPVTLNQGLSGMEEAQRMRSYWAPYHDALNRILARNPAPLILSIHSFTPVYEGQVREVELGVLFYDQEALASKLARSLEEQGLEARLNEPYSGANGMMYSVYRHAEAHGRIGLEIELRQDLVATPAQQQKLADALLRALEDVGHG